MKRPFVGAIVHLYDRSSMAVEPNKTGPYAAIVTWARSDGKVDCEAFPTREGPCGGMHYGIPHGDNTSTREDGILLRRWWQWPPEPEDKG